MINKASTIYFLYSSCKYNGLSSRYFFDIDENSRVSIFERNPIEEEDFKSYSEQDDEDDTSLPYIEDYEEQ